MDGAASKSQKWLSYFGMLMAWFAVIAQLKLMLENSNDNTGVIIIRFFSFFTILTNTLVALYFTCKSIGLSKKHLILRNGSITALATFILIVGLVYQIALRNVWNPEGLQRIIDELLHSIIPIYFVLYWFLFSKAEDYQVKSVMPWLAYPAIYMLYIFLRGEITNEYPYPFVNVPEIGYLKALLHSLVIFAFSIIVMFVMSFIGKELILKRRR